jgi:Na+/H+-dicarboxylate symporter
MHLERFLLLQVRRVLLSVFALTIALIGSITYGSLGHPWLLIASIVIALVMFIIVLFLPTHLLENPMRHARRLKP